MDPDELVPVDLDASERKLLRHGLLEWGGPASCTEELAVAMGFRSVDDLFQQGQHLMDAIGEGDPLSRRDWTRVLVATEFVFSSLVFGAAWDWAIVALPDDESFRILRQVQRKLHEGRCLVGSHIIGTRPPRMNVPPPMPGS
jgi:hypothetical protein